MTELKFQWQKFKIEDSAKDFLEKYISKIKKYAESHNISDDLVDDIYQSILEKLFELKWEITQKKVVQIVNSIWEPEEIFAEEMDFEAWWNEKKSEQNPNSLYFYEKFQKWKWTRPQDWAIFLWVCNMFGQATWRNVWFWRALAIFWSWVFLAWWLHSLFVFGCFYYLLLALIFPIKDKNYNHKSPAKYFITQILDIRFVISNSVSRFFEFCRWIVTKAISAVIRFFSKIFGPFWRVIKRLFLVLWSLFLIFVIVGLWIFLYYLIFGFVRWNIDYTAIFPAITKWGVIMGIASAFMLLLASIWSLFKKKFSNNVSLISAIWLGILAVIVAFISVWEMVNTLTTYDKMLTKETEIAVSNRQEPVYIYMDWLADIWGSLLGHGGLINHSRYVNILVSEDDNIKVVYNFTFKWWEELLTQVVENLSEIEYEWLSWNVLILSLQNKELFKKVTPAIPVSIDIDLYIPKDISFEAENSFINLINMDFPWWAKKYGTHWYRNCGIITYHEETNSFYCPLSMSAGSRKLIVETELKSMIDEISPLQWSNFARSQSPNRQQYRYLDSTNIRNDHQLLAKISDRFFNFFIEIEYKIDDETGEFTLIKSELKDIEQKWVMDKERMDQYLWWENLATYTIKTAEQEESHEKKLEDRIDELEKKMDEVLNSIWE